MSNRITRRKQRQLLLSFMQQARSCSFRLLEYWQEAIEREGYARIEDAIIGIYRETGSTSETARRLNFSRQTISRKLRELGEPINGPGGANNPWGRGGKPDTETEG